jgi:hypothetical protein
MESVYLDLIKEIDNKRTDEINVLDMICDDGA